MFDIDYLRSDLEMNHFKGEFVYYLKKGSDEAEMAQLVEK